MHRSNTKISTRFDEREESNTLACKEPSPGKNSISFYNDRDNLQMKDDNIC